MSGQQEMKPITWARFPTNAMAYMIELAHTFAQAVDHNQKFRVVVEYDPEAPKTIMTVFTPEDGHTILECPTPPQLAYPLPKEHQGT